MAHAPARRTATWNLTDAKAKFSALFQRALDGEPQRIVRRGHEAVIVVAESDYRPPESPQPLVQLFSALRGVDIDLARSSDEGREAPEL